jgi:hypothetical protein
MARGKRAGARVAEANAPTPPAAPPLVANEGPYGSRQATEEQAAGAPMYEDQVQQTPTQAPANIPPGPMPNLGGPTQRPNEPLTAGLPGQQGQGADAVEVLRSIYKSFPSPWIAALIGDDF